MTSSNYGDLPFGEGALGGWALEPDLEWPREVTLRGALLRYIHRQHTGDETADSVVLKIAPAMVAYFQGLLDSDDVKGVPPVWPEPSELAEDDAAAEVEAEEKKAGQDKDGNEYAPQESWNAGDWESWLDCPIKEHLAKALWKDFPAEGASAAKQKKWTRSVASVMCESLDLHGPVTGMVLIHPVKGMRTSTLTAMANDEINKRRKADKDAKKAAKGPSKLIEDSKTTPDLDW